MTSNGIISAPVTITDIKNTIGLNSTGLWDLVTRARTGGVNSRAFNTGDGYLIKDARPFWNIYSNESPGEWAPQKEAEGPLTFRMKMDSSGKLRASMGDFRGYNHNSSAPTVGGGDYHFTQGAGSGSLVREFTFKPMLGSYNWKKVAGATLYRAAIKGDNIGTVYGTPVEISSEAKTISITLTINTNNAATYNYSLYVYIGSGTVNDFNSLGYVPDVGSMRIIIDPKPVITAAVAVKESGSYRYNVFSMAEGVTSNNTTRFSGTYRLNSGVSTDGKLLTKITYKWGSTEAGNAGSLDVTSFNHREGPSYLRSYPAGDNVEAFTADPSRVPTGFETNYQVTFWYG